MKLSAGLVCVGLSLVAIVAGQGYIGTGGQYLGFIPEDFGLPTHGPVWKLTGKGGKITGDGWRNHFCYNNGGCNQMVDATLTVDVNTETNKGLITVEFETTGLDLTNFTDGDAAPATWTKCKVGGNPAPCFPEAAGSYMDMNGKFRIEYPAFVQDGSNTFKEGGIADNVIIHGPQAPVFPAVHAFLGTWGPAKIYRNDVDIFPNTGGGAMIGHTMFTERVYSAVDGKVYGADFPDTTYTERRDENPDARGDVCNSNVFMGPMAGTNVGDGCSLPNDDPAPLEFHANIRLDGYPAPNKPIMQSNPMWLHMVWHDITDNSPAPDDIGEPDSAAALTPALALVTLAVAAVARLLHF